MIILADHKKLIYSGRIDWSNPLEPIFVFPCTFVKMKFTGNVLKVHVKNRNAYWNNYLGVILDGKQSSVLLPKDGEALLDIPVKGAEKTEHEVMIFKRQDSCHELTFLGFELDQGAEIMDSDPLPERRIEVYGPGPDAAYLRWSLLFPYCVDVWCISGISGNQYNYAELSGIMGNHSSIVYYLLYQKISKSKKNTGVMDRDECFKSGAYQ